jgi:hypothetical protein
MKLMSNPETAAAKERVWTRFSESEKDTLIPWSEWNDVCGLHHRTARGYGVVQWFKSRMRRVRRVVVYVNTREGLKVMRDREANVRVIENREGRRARQAHKQVVELDAVDPEALTMAQRQIHVAMRRKAREDRRESRKALRTAVNRLRPSGSLPMRKPPTN